jgi:hypothetical protein
MKKLLILPILILLISCSGDRYEGVDDTPPPPPPPDPPLKTTLITPANQTECLDGEDVEFTWNESENTDSYNIVVKNLLTNAESANLNTTSKMATIKLEIGQPYSWYVISTNSDSSETATSDTWKFYLKGEQTSNYAPFPADFISPKSEATVSKGDIKLEWSGSDANASDNLTYDIYLGTSNPPSSTIKSNHTGSSLNHTISENGTYYWKIITKDNQGSNSDSGVSMFKVE